MRGPGRLQERGGPVTGRHRVRSVVGRDGKLALSLECGCGHKRTIGLASLEVKLRRAPEPRIWL
jgi:hypothetical protein